MTDRSPRGLVFPLLLVVIGGALLLANLRLIPPLDWRAILSLWPVLLILGGIDLLLARRQPLLALVLEIAVVAGALALAAAAPAGIVADGQVTSSASVPREGATSLSLRVTGGAGSYVVRGGASALVEATSSTPAGTELRVNTTRSGGAADVRIDPAGAFDWPFFMGGRRLEVDVRVASDVPASVRLDGGAGDFTLDLRAIRATDARVATGASNVTVVLPTPQGDVPVRIEAGAASIRVEVPAGVEARVTTRGGAISLNSENARLVPSGGAAETAGYAAARDRVTVTVEAGATSVTVR